MRVTSALSVVREGGSGKGEEQKKGEGRGVEQTVFEDSIRHILG